MNLQRRWTLVTALGFCCAFVSFPLGEPLSRAFAPASIADIRLDQLPEHLRPETLPAWMDLPTYEALYWFNLLGHIPALLVFGAIIGTAQYLVIRRLRPRAWTWIVGTAIGFAAILVLEVVERHIVVGPTAGPVEPILIVFGGGSLAGALQWLQLRSQAMSAWQYLASWVLGLILGVALAVPVMIGLGIVFGEAISRLEATAPHVSWGIEIGLFGLIFGAVAGWVSSYGLRRVLTEQTAGDRLTSASS